MIRKIVAITVKKRSEHAVKVQEILTKHGCVITTRLGTSEAGCTEKGLIILQTYGEKNEVETLISELNNFDDVDVNSMSIN